MEIGAELEKDARMDCDSDKFEYTGQGGETPTDGLSYWDTESYSAGFKTDKGFGCIHWRKKTYDETKCEVCEKEDWSRL